MKAQKYLVFIGVLVMLFSVSCKRGSIEEPSPFGPSTFAVLLNISANPNIIFAGASRESSLITATLQKYDGIPLANRALYFSIRDSAGNQLELGYFEGNTAVKKGLTDQNGRVSVRYYGPLENELSSEATIYVVAALVDEGKYTISEMVAIDIFTQSSDMRLSLSASPNVLMAGETRESSILTATLFKGNLDPVADQSIYFEITDESGNSLTTGYFEGNKLNVSKTTDQNGTAATQYYGPLASELTQNMTVYIKAVTTGNEKEPISDTAPIYILRNASDMILELSPNPGVLFAGEARQTSTISAKLFTSSSSPIANKILYFEIKDASGNTLDAGFFEGNKAAVSKTTDQNGTASVQYHGPLASELTENITVYISAIVSGDESETVSDTAPIYIIKDDYEMELEVEANPVVLFAGETRESSTITGELLSSTGSPLANKVVYFEIKDASGNKLNAGFFEGNKAALTKVTDQNGQVSLTYYGPLATDITENTTAYITATVSGENNETVTDNVAIYIIREVFEVQFEMLADPNVLWATHTRPESTIKATLKTADGIPISGRRVYFEITSGPGNFSNWESKIFAETDDDGTATVTYMGPRDSDITADTTVTIRGRPATSSSTDIFADVTIRIIKGNQP